MNTSKSYRYHFYFGFTLSVVADSGEHKATYNDYQTKK
jgi:hypothetical protein